MRGDTAPPLFSGLLHRDGDKDNTNKMALFERSDAPGFCSFVSSSSSNVGSTKRKVRPSINEYYPPTTKCTDEHTTTAFLQPRSYRNLLVERKNSWGDEMSSSQVKKEECGDTCIPDELVRVIGPKLFLRARKTMIHQQKIFSWQIFELHRLITVQRLMARSPETFHPIKPSIKFPPMNKLLYVSPLDTTSSSSSSPKTKIDAVKSDPGHVAQPLPWCFPPPPPPPGNQWLIPVRSPSEGLVYKPYPGPCFPVMMSGAPNEHGNGGGCYTAESYFPPYPMPLISEVDKSEWQERDELSLFPTTPSSEQRNEHKVQVIKVVPHSRDSTPASTARILQSLQQGRRKHD